MGILYSECVEFPQGSHRRLRIIGRQYAIWGRTKQAQVVGCVSTRDLRQQKNDKATDAYAGRSGITVPERLLDGFCTGTKKCPSDRIQRGKEKYVLALLQIEHFPCQ